jgi:hypothetical protein
MSNEINVFKIECCGSYDQLPTERTKQKVCRFLSEIVSEKRLLCCSQRIALCRNGTKNVSYKGERESDLSL